MRLLRKSLAALLLAAAALAPGLLPGGAAAEEPAASRVFADSFLVWIYRAPRRDPAPIGYLRGGQSATLRAEGERAADRPATRKGCSGGWYAVAPAGYICKNSGVSLRPTRYSTSMKSLAPRTGAYPFDFSLSMGTPSYRRVPTPEEWTRRERKFGTAKARPLPPHWRGHEELVSSEQLPVGPLTHFLREASSVSRSPEKRLIRRDVPFGSMLALTGAFEHGGRRFYQSADGTIVPADRMRLFKRSEFQGIELGEEWQLPLAWPRQETRRYSISAECKVPDRAPDGELGEAAFLKKRCLLPLEETAARRKPEPLTGRQVNVAGTHFVETRAGKWMPKSYLYVARQRSPKSASLDKWIHFDISEGALVAYRGALPTFATLASPGIGGVPAKGADALSTRTTPVGSYRIVFKHVTDDMSPESGEHRKFWIADVPYAMYFQQPFAIHVAYWHESFGEPMSGGCINVSPRDGARLFSWTDPPLPDGWYGVGAGTDFGLGTTVRIER